MGIGETGVCVIVVGEMRKPGQDSYMLEYRKSL